jgi:hypothetical protein
VLNENSKTAVTPMSSFTLKHQAVRAGSDHCGSDVPDIWAIATFGAMKQPGAGPVAARTAFCSPHSARDTIAIEIDAAASH